MELNIFFVGQANCTILWQNNKYIIYDCGSRLKNWKTENNLFNINVEVIEKMKECAEEIIIVVSHNDFDHYNLLSFIEETLIKNEKTYTIINRKTNSEKDFKNNLNKLKTFFEGYKINTLYPDVINGEKKEENYYSLILKITGTFEKKEKVKNTYSFLLTGDSNKSALENIIYKHCIEENKKIINEAEDCIIKKTNEYIKIIEQKKKEKEKEKEKIEEKIKEEKEKIKKEKKKLKIIYDKAKKELFKDVIFVMPAHHGSLINDSYEWTLPLKYSIYPVLVIMSSDPSKYNRYPSIEMINRLITDVEKNLKRINNNYKSTNKIKALSDI